MEQPPTNIYTQAAVELICLHDGHMVHNGCMLNRRYLSCMARSCTHIRKFCIANCQVDQPTPLDAEALQSLEMVELENISGQESVAFLETVISALKSSCKIRSAGVKSKHYLSA